MPDVLTPQDKASVKDQYENLPYPDRDPQEEVKRLLCPSLSTLPLYVNVCCRGVAPDWDSFRVLDAGGGTGDATIYLAEQLKKTGAQVVYADFSVASRKVCEARAKVRGLKNIRFETLSLMDAAAVKKLGRFDLIISSGVLHHLPDPDVGLLNLRAQLKDDGAMAIMVYGGVPRRIIEDVRRVIAKLIPENLDKAEKIRLVRLLLENLPPSHGFNHPIIKRLYSGNIGNDHELYDLFLHSQERGYTVDELYAWMDKAQLHLSVPPGMMGYAEYYKPEVALRHPALSALTDAMTVQQRMALAEALHGSIERHMFFATVRQQPTRAVRADSMIASLAHNHAMEVPRMAEMVAKGQPGQSVQINGLHLSANLQIGPTTGALLRAWDGNTPFADWLAAAGGAGAEVDVERILWVYGMVGELVWRVPACRDDRVLKVVPGRGW